MLSRIFFCFALIGIILSDPDCSQLPSRDQLRTALQQAVNQDNGGYGLNMWATLVNLNGEICHIAHSGETVYDQWLGSRLISVQKAYTSNAFSLNNLGVATCNLYSPTQPGGSLFELTSSSLLDSAIAYLGPVAQYGSDNDPLVGRTVGGLIVFGGGLALYNSDKQRVGAIGVSGDTSCADHAISWRTRHNLNLDYVPGGLGPDPARPDNIIYDPSHAYYQVHCLNATAETLIANSLPVVRT